MMMPDLPTIISPDTQRKGDGGGSGGSGGRRVGGCGVWGGDSKARTPPGQTLTAKWPVLHYGNVPTIATGNWTLRIWGLVENEITLNWEQFNALPKTHVRCDMHCVTHWSRLNNLFTGVSTQTVLDLVKPLATARFVMQHARSAPGNDWTTNMPLGEFLDNDCLLATHHDGQRLTADHGGPVRGIVPRLYLWKGAKWISGIELRNHDAPGFWEQNGYHMHGDPWTEQRFGW